MSTIGYICKAAISSPLPMPMLYSMPSATDSVALNVIRMHKPREKAVSDVCELSLGPTSTILDLHQLDLKGVATSTRLA